MLQSGPSDLGKSHPELVVGFSAETRVWSMARDSLKETESNKGYFSVKRNPVFWFFSTFLEPTTYVIPRDFHIGQ
jgi:hypothetical protein